MHKSVVAQQAVRDCEFLQLNHPEYSQHLGPSDYILFRNLKFYLYGTRFIDVQSPKIVVEAWLDRQDRKIVFQGCNSLDKKQKICTDVAGEYSEKYSMCDIAALRFYSQVAKLFDRPLYSASIVRHGKNKRSFRCLIYIKNIYSNSY